MTSDHTCKLDVGRPLVILGLLQNQWAWNPESVAAMFARRPEHRPQLIKLMLLRSVSGRRLWAAFGTWTDRIVWENASPGVAAKSSGQLPADIDHINRAIARVSPNIVITFGALAAHGIAQSGWTGRVVRSVHPAARGKDVHRQLCDAQEALERMVTESIRARELPK